MKLSSLLPGFILALYLAPATAEIYRCKGEHGNVTVSDRPCGEETTTFNRYRPAETHDNAPGHDKRDRLLRAFEEERRQARQQQADEEARRAEREMKCRQARENLAMVKRAGRIYNLDEDGNRVVQSDAARAETERQALDYVNHWCD
ncbi:MAG: DUF4124 domain-containing protein [Thiohalobacterales bacterium]|nr:DUF4124 domain-containing protein [Thiohalobacterales bacterium]